LDFQERAAFNESIHDKPLGAVRFGGLLDAQQTAFVIPATYDIKA